MVTTFNARARAVARMAKTAFDTAAQANGQQVERTLKNKMCKFATTRLCEDYISALVEAQDGACAITGIRLQFDGEEDDHEMLASLDRIDSSGHYEIDNLQVVCKFVNRWKRDDDDAAFRRLVTLLRSVTAEMIGE
jgi:hypothetical protein